MNSRKLYTGEQCIRRIFLSEVAAFEEDKVKFADEWDSLKIDDFHKMTESQKQAVEEL